jgi:hypothetical protein
VDTAWQLRAEQWRRFADWEAGQLRAVPSDFTRALAWMAQAHELARRHSPGWAEALDLEHVRSIGQVRAALARMRPVR